MLFDIGNTSDKQFRQKVTGRASRGFEPKLRVAGNRVLGVGFRSRLKVSFRCSVSLNQKRSHADYAATLSCTGDNRERRGNPATDTPGSDRLLGEFHVWHNVGSVPWAESPANRFRVKLYLNSGIRRIGGVVWSDTDLCSESLLCGPAR